MRAGLAERSGSHEMHPQGRLRSIPVGEPCKRGSLPAGRLVYVGDGYSDRCAALAADRVFARAGLADYLRGEGVPYEPFDTLLDVAAALS